MPFLTITKLAGSAVLLATAWCALTSSHLAQSADVVQPPQRDLVLSTWEPERWALPGGATLQRIVGRTPGGEPLTRLALPGPGEDQAVLVQINLPATAGDLSVFLRKTEQGAARHEALFQDAHGWGGTGNTLWGLNQDTTYTTPALKHGWSWRVGFFKTEVSPPYRFRGFRLNGGDKPGQPTIEAGPIHLSYTPDDKDWLYTDLQPKTISVRDGELPPLTLRIANLGTTPRTFRLSARPTERNLTPLVGTPLDLGSVTLEPNQVKELSVKLPLPVLGRYVLEYRAVGAGDAVTQQEKVEVVNARDLADGFRHWAAGRKWFTAPNQRVATGPDGKAKIDVTVASNGVSQVPLFPVLPRTPRAVRAIADPQTGGRIRILSDLPTIGKLFTKADQVVMNGPLQVLTTQLSPAWLVHSTDNQLLLFGDTAKSGLGAPSHLAFATAAGVRVVKAGTALDATQLHAMTQPWLLVWWAGSDGWATWDVPHLVTLQHRPASLKLDEHGVTVSFAGAAGYLATQPLYGYAKLSQQAAWQAHPEMFKQPAAWPELHTWTWDATLPPAVAARCNWWARALARIPYNVRESYVVDHAAGAVRVTDAFDYVDIKNDWGTVPVTLAPLSPTYAVAMRGGYPMTAPAQLQDLQYPTLYGPYCALEGATSINYSLNVGPYWMQTAEPNRTLPVDESTASRKAQARLVHEAARSAADAGETQMWDWHDENFVWYAQSGDIREPGYYTGFTGGSLRQDRKGWMQARVLHTLFDPARYKLDERSGTLNRRYIDGPGIGNWGSGDWGDSGKLGTDMIWDAYVYAYNTGDYQTIADKWDLITSLNTLPVTMSWIGVGRAAIAEMGDEAPPMLGLARLAYAVGDRDTYTAAVYWYARELVLHVVKEGAFTKWREQFAPWHPGLELPTETPTNLWGTNASWQPGGFRSTVGGENQWNNFTVRLDDTDTIRFQQRYARLLPERVMALAKPEELKKNAQLYFERVGVLGGDPAKAQTDFVQSDAKVELSTSYIATAIAAWREFPPKLEPLIPATTPTLTDDGWAWQQMNYFSGGLVNPYSMAKAKPPTLQWFWFKPPQVRPGVDWGDKWTFGSFAPAGKAVDGTTTEQPLNAVSSLWTFTLRSAP